ncbi:MAG: hypothetical protein ACYC8T_39080 [Myxococcaceae bacterium]
MRLALLVCLCSLTAAAASPEPAWEVSGTLAGGRAFVADRALVLDQSIAKPSKVPRKPMPGVLLESLPDLLGSPQEGTVRPAELRPEGAHHRGPGGLFVSTHHLKFLVSRIGAAELTFDFAGLCNSLVVRKSGVAVGALMPMQGDFGATPVSHQTPGWASRGKLSDGRTFVADSSVVLLEPGPSRALPEMPPAHCAAIEKWMSAAPHEKYAITSISCSNATTYQAPGGALLNARYIDFLRARYAGRGLTLGPTGEGQPIVVLAGGKPVGVLMPMR